MPNVSGMNNFLNLIMSEERSKRRSFSPCFHKPLLVTKNFCRKIGSDVKSERKHPPHHAPESMNTPSPPPNRDRHGNNAGIEAHLN